MVYLFLRRKLYSWGHCRGLTIPVCVIGVGLLVCGGVLKVTCFDMVTCFDTTYLGL